MKPWRYRSAWIIGLSILVPLLAIATGEPALAVTPTPTPTQLGHNSNSNFNGYVDNNAVLPWGDVALPLFTTPSVTPTLYNATAIHATEFAGNSGTATAQVGQFNAPIAQISTPVAAMVGLASTPNAGDIDTGVDVGGGSISFSSFAEDFADDVGPVVGSGVAFFQGLIELGNYSPWLGGLVLGLIVGVIIGAFIELMIPIVKAGAWLLNIIAKVAFIMRLIAFFFP